MSYDKSQDIIIVALDVTLSIFKGVKKLRALIKKKTAKAAKSN